LPSGHNSTGCAQLRTAIWPERRWNRWSKAYAGTELEKAAVLSEKEVIHTALDEVSVRRDPSDTGLQWRPLGKGIARWLLVLGGAVAGLGLLVVNLGVGAVAVVKFFFGFFSFDPLPDSGQKLWCLIAVVPTCIVINFVLAVRVGRANPLPTRHMAAYAASILAVTTVGGIALQFVEPGVRSFFSLP
jgi:hypothetical protein